MLAIILKIVLKTSKKTIQKPYFKVRSTLKSNISKTDQHGKIMKIVPNRTEWVLLKSIL